MGIFFRSVTQVPTVPEPVEGPERTGAEGTRVEQMAAVTPLPSDDQGKSEFAWGRFIASLLFMILLFAVGMYTAHDPLPEVNKWSAACLKVFEVVLPGIGGIILGEIASKK